MRSFSLANIIAHHPGKSTLRERLSATKEKAKRSLTGNRAAHKPEFKPALEADRTVLVNYSTWLWHERKRVCRELYPHMGRKAFDFVLGLNAAEDWHFKGSGRSGGWAEKPPATDRATKVLDLVGVDWRRDVSQGRDPDLDSEGFADNGERPAMPHGWPRPDAELLEALDDLTRLDAAQEAMFKVGAKDRAGDTSVGYADLEAARYRVMDRLAKVRAESLVGLQTKARALLTDGIASSQGIHEDGLRDALLNDLLEITGGQIAPRTDPIFALIEKGRRLLEISDAAFAIPVPPKGDTPKWIQEATDSALENLVEHCRGVLLQTVPQTAAGCRELARFAVEYFEHQEVPISDDHELIPSLIAKSPLL